MFCAPLFIDKKTLPKNIFTSKKPPSISIQSYFERIIKYSKIEESTLIVTLIYIDRLCDFSQLVLTEFNIHRYKIIYIKFRVILAAVVLGIKYNEDDYYSNEYYAKVGGVSLQEINVLELEAVLALRHTLFVDEEFFNKYKIYLKHYLK